MTKREEALAQIQRWLFEYSGLGPLVLNDMMPELKAFERAVRDEEASEIAAVLEPFPLQYSNAALIVRARIAARAK